MAQGQFQIAFYRSHADAETGRDILRRSSLDRNTIKYVARPRRQFGQGPLESIDIGARLNDSRWARSFVTDVEQCVDFGGANAEILRFLAILGNIDRDAEYVVGGTADRHGIGDTLQPEERLVQGLVGEVRRSQTAGQFLDEAVIIVSKLPPQPHSIDFSHVPRPPRHQPDIQIELFLKLANLVTAGHNTFMTVTSRHRTTRKLMRRGHIQKQ